MVVNAIQTLLIKNVRSTTGLLIFEDVKFKDCPKQKTKKFKRLLT